MLVVFKEQDKQLLVESKEQDKQLLELAKQLLVVPKE